VLTLTVNGKSYTVDVDPETPILWVLRDILGLTGTKYGCGIEKCFACLFLLDGEAKPACKYAVKECVGRQVTTIEGLSPDRSNPIQKAWVKHQVPQCGFCQSGIIMRAEDLRRKGKSGAEIASAVNNLCVCGTYQRVDAALKSL
jgi:isoquinoline 1-oxidoreductase subunit alpha